MKIRLSMARSFVMNKHQCLLPVISLVTVVLFGLLTPFVYAQEDDVFGRLEAIPFNEAMPEELINKAAEVVKGKDRTAYAFDSGIYSHPHIVHVQDNQVVFVQLTLIADKAEEYRLKMEAMGEPEYRQYKTQSEILMAFPSQGLAFIVNGRSGQIERFQRFPVKTVPEYAALEGAGYVPVERTPETTSLNKAPLWRRLWNRMMDRPELYLGYGLLLLAGSGGLMFLNRRIDLGTKVRGIITKQKEEL
jgi:hypothetical protein